jgi:phage terminase large subunit-like protein
LDFEQLPLAEQVRLLAPYVDHPEKGAQVAAALARVRQQLRENPLHGVDLTRYPKQTAYLENRSLIKGFIGGNGTGKSTIGCIDDVIQIVDRDAVPSHLRQFKRWDPPVGIRVAAPDEGVLESTVLPKFREYLPKSQLVGGNFDKSYRGNSRRLTLKNGSWVLFNTFKQDRDSWAGVELRRTRFDEEPPGEHGFGLYTESMARLRKFTPDAQICFTMTPLLGLTWVADEFERDDAWHVTAGIMDNPFLPDREAVIRSLQHLSEAEKRAVIQGEFVHFAGAVVNLDQRHIVPAITPDFLRDKTVYVGLDHGIRRAGVVWVAFDRANEMLVFDEFYPENLTVPAIAKAVKERNARWEIKKPIYIGDPSGRNREMVSGASVEDAYLKEGIAMIRGNNDRRAGVLQLRARLEAQALLICENCEKLRWEAKRWLVATDEVIAEGKAKVKGAEGSFATVGPDHLWDPTRYIAQERLWYQPPQSRRSEHWSPASGTTPPKHLLLGRRPVEHGPIGAY